MEACDVRALLPLAKGSLREFRNQVRSRLVIAALRQLAGTEVTAERVQGAIVETFKFKDYPIEAIVSELDSLLTNGTLKKGKQGYVIVALPEHLEYEDLKKPFVKEFGDGLRDLDKDYDSYDYRGLEEAIDKSVTSLTLVMVSAISGAEATGDPMSTERTRSILLSPWKEGPAKLAKAGEYFIDFIQSNSPSATALLTAIYEACLTVDLLSRGQKLEEALEEAPDPDRIFLDTNCLSAVLCPYNRYHETVQASLRLARRYGFDLGYLSRTKLELNRLIQAANRIIKQGDLVEGAKRNELVMDFARRHEAGKWSDRSTELGLWVQELNEKFGVVQFSESDRVGRNEIEQEFETTYQILLRSHGETKEPDVIAHDVRLYGIVEERKDATIGLFGSPFAETLDRYLCEADALLTAVKGYPTAVVHATHWLNTLSQFVDASFEEADVSRVAQAILRNLVEPFEPSLSVDEYSRLLATRYDWEPEQASLIAQILTESMYRAELERALYQTNANNVATITQRILDDGELIEAVVGRTRAEKEVKDLRARMHSLGQEVIADRKIIQYLREAASRPVVVQLQIPGVPEDARYLMERLIEEITQKMPVESKSEGIDKSILDVSDKGGFKKALMKVEFFLQRAASTVNAAQTLYPVAKLIWGFLSGTA